MKTLPGRARSKHVAPSYPEVSTSKIVQDFSRLLRTFRPEISVPVAVTVFPGEIYQAPRSWAERAYPKLIYFNEIDKGRQFAAWEQPELFATEIRAAFRSLPPMSTHAHLTQTRRQP